MKRSYTSGTASALSRALTDSKDELDPQFPPCWWVWRTSCIPWFLEVFLGLLSGLSAREPVAWMRRCPTFLRKEVAWSVCVSFVQESCLRYSSAWWNWQPRQLPSPFQQSCCSESSLSSALGELACVSSPIFFTFHPQRLIFCKWHWLLTAQIFF